MKLFHDMVIDILVRVSVGAAFPYRVIGILDRVSVGEAFS